MRAMFSKEERQRHAITDLYDERRRRFLVQYPIPLVIALGLSGLLAFMITGFYGYRDSLEPDVTRFLFGKPWPIYLWFCALIITLQISILRHRSLRRQLTMTLAVTMFCIVFVGVVDYYNREVLDFLNQLVQDILGKRILLQYLGTWPWTYTLLNALIVVVYWLDTIRRWVRRAQGKSPIRRIDLGLGEQQAAGAAARGDDMPTMQELVSGDLIAGAVLMLLLSLFFRADTINFFTKLLQGSNANELLVNTCTVSLPIHHCVVGAAHGNPPTLEFLDLIQALLYLPIGLIILALSATLSGLGAVGGVEEDRPARDGATAAAGTGSATAVPPTAAANSTSSTASVSEQVSLTVLNTLQAAIKRRIRLATASLAGSLRNVVWPLLILVGVIGVAAASRNIQQYLHILSDTKTLSLLNDADRAGLQQLLNQHLLYISPVLALLWGVLAAIMIVLSASLLLFRVRVAENALRFLGLIGFTVLLTFWLFSLALSVFNWLFALTNISRRVPFPQPGVTTMISFASLLIAAVVLLVRRARGPKAGAGADAREPAEVAAAGPRG